MAKEFPYLHLDMVMKVGVDLKYHIITVFGLLMLAGQLQIQLPRLRVNGLLRSS